MRTISRLRAASAMWMPISRVRRATRVRGDAENANASEDQGEQSQA
jgi:hypothetical protein